MKISKGLPLLIVVGAAILVLVNIGMLVGHLTLLMPVLSVLAGLYGLATKRFTLTLASLIYWSLDIAPMSLIVLIPVWVISKAWKMFSDTRVKVRDESR